MAVCARSTKPKTASKKAGQGAKSRSRRAKRTAARTVFWAAVVLAGLGSPFAYINSYANLAQTSTSRSKLVELCRQEKIKNERLKVEFVRRSSPANVVVAAEELDMTYATAYDYLEKPRTIAKR